MDDAVRRVARAMCVSGVLVLVAACVAWGTGEDVSASGGSWHTHADAMIVLLVLGLLLVGNGFACSVWAEGLAEARKHAEWNRRRTGPGSDR